MRRAGSASSAAYAALMSGSPTRSWAMARWSLLDSMQLLEPPLVGLLEVDHCAEEVPRVERVPFLSDGIEARSERRQSSFPASRRSGRTLAGPHLLPLLRSDFNAVMIGRTSDQCREEVVVSGLACPGPDLINGGVDLTDRRDVSVASFGAQCFANLTKRTLH